MLSERRKADRTKMMAQVIALGRQYDATIETHPEGDCFLGPRATLTRFVFSGGLAVSVGFDGQSCQPDVHVLSWHMDYRTDTEHTEYHSSKNAKISAAFALLCDSVNLYHRQKATRVCYGFDEVLRHLTATFMCIQCGIAYKTDN